MACRGDRVGSSANISILVFTTLFQLGRKSRSITHSSQLKGVFDLDLPVRSNLAFVPSLFAEELPKLYEGYTKLPSSIRADSLNETCASKNNQLKNALILNGGLRPFIQVIPNFSTFTPIFCFLSLRLSTTHCSHYWNLHNMPTLETHDGYQLWHYIPSLPAAIIFTILFGVATFLHIFKMFQNRTWFCIPFVIGGFCKLTKTRPFSKLRF